jgi:hypothetical protein
VKSLPPLRTARFAPHDPLHPVIADHEQARERLDQAQNLVMAQRARWHER